uniref:Uncharacterized protein n=1 Tax=Arundo donax TaxID=35708 RepID=A0A0A9BYQ5_ARUDO
MDAHESAEWVWKDDVLEELSIRLLLIKNIIVLY